MLNILIKIYLKMGLLKLCMSEEKRYTVYSNGLRPAREMINFFEKNDSFLSIGSYASRWESEDFSF